MQKSIEQSNKTNAHVHGDLTVLRDELATRAFDEFGRVKDSTLAEVVWKINSCLYQGYPRKTPNTVGKL